MLKGGDGDGKDARKEIGWIPAEDYEKEKENHKSEGLRVARSFGALKRVFIIACVGKSWRIFKGVFLVKD